MIRFHNWRFDWFLKHIIISIYFAIEDQWIGHYRDKNANTSYIAILPCIIIRIRGKCDYEN